MVVFAGGSAINQALSQASQHLQAGNTAAADAMLLPLLEQFSSDPRLLHLVGTVRMHQNRHAEAAQLFERARTANPREAVLAFSHATALRWLERHGEAADAFGEAYRLRPGYAEAYFEASASLEQAGRLDEAEAVLRQWLTAMPGNPRGQQALAELLLVRQRPDEAEPLLRQILPQTIPPLMRCDVLRSLGLALYRQGKEVEALEHCEASASLRPDPKTDAIRASAGDQRRAQPTGGRREVRCGAHSAGIGARSRASGGGGRGFADRTGGAGQAGG